MKRNIIFGLLILFGCKGQTGKKATEDLQKLNTILPTANWRVIDGPDTSYLYFSRQTDSSYKVSQFKLVKGDSSITDQAIYLSPEIRLPGTGIKNCLYLKL